MVDVVSVVGAEVLTDSTGIIAGHGRIMVHEPASKRRASDAGQSPSRSPIVTRTFRFDDAFDSGCSNVEVYLAAIEPKMSKFITGGNALTVVTYGSAGSGKTYTMFGPEDGTEQGITELALATIFHRLDALSNRPDVYISVFEICQDRIQDLLQDRAKLTLLSDPRAGRARVAGLHEVQVTDAEDAWNVVCQGLVFRAVPNDPYVELAGPSHVIVQIQLRDRIRGTPKGIMNLVDLAGFERGGTAGTAAAAGVNKSLLALKECIRALNKQSAAAEEGEGNAASVHVPFRASKLTLVLRDALSSQDACTVIIACVRSAYSATEQTLNTLRYAVRMKTIKVVKTQVQQVFSERAGTWQGDTHASNSLEDQGVYDDDDYNDEYDASESMALESTADDQVSVKTADETNTSTATAANAASELVQKSYIAHEVPKSSPTTTAKSPPLSHSNIPTPTRLQQHVEATKVRSTASPTMSTRSPVYGHSRVSTQTSIDSHPHQRQELDRDIARALVTPMTHGDNRIDHLLDTLRRSHKWMSDELRNEEHRDRALLASIAGVNPDLDRDKVRKAILELELSSRRRRAAAEGFEKACQEVWARLDDGEAVARLAVEGVLGRAPQPTYTPRVPVDQADYALLRNQDVLSDTSEEMRGRRGRHHVPMTSQPSKIPAPSQTARSRSRSAGRGLTQRQSVQTPQEPMPKWR